MHVPAYITAKSTRIYLTKLEGSTKRRLFDPLTPTDLKAELRETLDIIAGTQIILHRIQDDALIVFAVRRDPKDGLCYSTPIVVDAPIAGTDPIVSLHPYFQDADGAAGDQNIAELNHQAGVDHAA